MKVFSEAADVRAFSRECRQRGLRVGFVPTMGALHDGHLSLVSLAKEHCDVVIVSNYVNPTQFAAHEDFDVYPAEKGRDREKLQAIGCDAVFEPTSLYSDRTVDRGDTGMVVGKQTAAQESHQTYVTVERLEKPLCGVTRPHFFRGVATVVTKLFNIVEPDVAVFGLKDYQQFQVIKTLTKELNFDIEVVGGPIYRGPDGLAMSSRNALLHEEVRPKCTVLYQSLKWAEETLTVTPTEGIDPGLVIEEIQKRITQQGGTVDYVKIVDAETLDDVTEFSPGLSVMVAVASFFWNRAKTPQVRLIDNMVITLPSN